MKLQHRSDYAKRRAEDYPDVATQMDMLWHSMNSGEIPKAEPFFSSIEAVKNKYPKPPPDPT